jgi:hypothetical protein
MSSASPILQTAAIQACAAESVGEESPFYIAPASYNPVRRACIQAVESRWFANTTMAFIILNSLSMGLADYSKVDPETMELATEGSYRNQVNSGILEPVFIAVFSIECVIKVIAMGFVWGKDSYLRDPWKG